MSIEAQIILNKFKPRDYQIPIMDAILNKGYKKVLAVMPRRAGKDLVAFNIAIRWCIAKPCVVFYIFPTYTQAKKVIWQSITNSGERILDYIPPELIASKNSQDMSIRFTNGSLLQLVGSENYDALMGTNPNLCIFSEYALQDPMAYTMIRPILAANGGTALFISTPRGKNHMWELFNLAIGSPNWFAYKLTLADTKHITNEQLEEERREMSEDLIQQEWFCSFELGVEGAIYAKIIDQLRLKGQIGQVPYEPGYRVYTAWDIGRDTTSIIFFQITGQLVRIIDYYEKVGENLEYFVRVLDSKKYLYAKHFFPHDMQVTEWAGPKMTRLHKARDLGLDAVLVREKHESKVGLEDGIECVRSTLNRVWIDETNCGQLIKCLENYRREFDPQKRVYGTQPLHNWASHGADAMRYLCLAIPKASGGNMTKEDVERQHQKALYGETQNMPTIFREDLNLPGFQSF